MRETYLDLPSRLEDAFPEIDNDIMIELRNENEEYAAFTQYLHLVRQRDNMERQQIYFRGHTDAVAYLKKIKAI
uniref:DUF6664 family protein n=1 Tax=Coprococcus catus TaxID=116085 RepID=UPI0022E4EA88|nr:hypothetical protein [Coprococcus catus]